LERGKHNRKEENEWEHDIKQPDLLEGEDGILDDEWHEENEQSLF
jgi:hypothetical protein